MSKYVDEIITLIRTSPDDWVRTGDWSIKYTKSNIEIEQFGNTMFGLPFTSCVTINIDGLEGTWEYLSLGDKFKLERAYKWWLKTADIDRLKQNK